MMKGPSCLLLLALVCIALVLSRAPAASAATCSPLQLIPCAGAMNSAAKPSDLCCSRLREQQACFCQYARNPRYQKYFNSDNARKVSDACGVPFPKC
ncbi:hypothetical protein Taro_012296 [Colocasia esculenta]|uniref:Bifunctional inhibitor/plant lipid transfer protein/seed storage helical domain-containing protein n=1 Tax=Colocasia esculenta TaxID=4460 RepID=A0A843UIM9_COLES|nr:hypothetical protein [Colocasia esculenta]